MTALFTSLFKNNNTNYFDTLCVQTDDLNSLRTLAEAEGINFGYINNHVLISIDETTTIEDIIHIATVFAKHAMKNFDASQLQIQQNLNNIPTH